MKLVRVNKISNAVDVQRLFEQRLAEADEYFYAAKEVLLVDGELDFNLRAKEILVVYEDCANTNRDGSPKRKKESLSVLLKRLAGLDIRPQHSFLTIADPRVVLRNAGDHSLRVLEKFAKFTRPDKRDLKTIDDLQEITDMIVRVAEKMGTDFQTELQMFLDECSHKLRPDLREALIDLIG